VQSDFYLFPKLKEFVRGCKFTDDEDMVEEQEQLFFHNEICALENHWTTFISVADVEK